MSLPGTRARLAAGGGLALWLGSALAVHYRLFDVQHAAAALVAVALGLWWGRRRDGAEASVAAPAGVLATSSSPSPIPAA